MKCGFRKPWITRRGTRNGTESVTNVPSALMAREDTTVRTTMEAATLIFVVGSRDTAATIPPTMVHPSGRRGPIERLIVWGVFGWHTTRPHRQPFYRLTRRL